MGIGRGTAVTDGKLPIGFFMLKLRCYHPCRSAYNGRRRSSEDRAGLENEAIARDYDAGRWNGRNGTDDVCDLGMVLTQHDDFLGRAGLHLAIHFRCTSDRYSSFGVNWLQALSTTRPHHGEKLTARAQDTYFATRSRHGVVPGRSMGSTGYWGVDGKQRLSGQPGNESIHPGLDAPRHVAFAETGDDLLGHDVPA